MKTIPDLNVGLLTLLGNAMYMFPFSIPVSRPVLTPDRYAPWLVMAAVDAGAEVATSENQAALTCSEAETVCVGRLLPSASLLSTLHDTVYTPGVLLGTSNVNVLAVVLDSGLVGRLPPGPITLVAVNPWNVNGELTVIVAVTVVVPEDDIVILVGLSRNPKCSVGVGGVTPPPAGPVGPRSPVGPRVPAPVGPVAPVGPGTVLAAPMSPVGPVDPVVPMLPVGPVGPATVLAAPMSPVCPLGPVAPMLPMSPVGPVEPVEPVDPMEPMLPVGPVTPRPPVLPVGPGTVLSAPVGPRGPAGPVAPCNVVPVCGIVWKPISVVIGIILMAVASVKPAVTDTCAFEAPDQLSYYSYSICHGASLGVWCVIYIREYCDHA